MKRQSFLVMCFLTLGLLVNMAGCKRDQPTSTSLSSDLAVEQRQIEGGTSQPPAEDIRGSEIESPQYPEGTAVIVAIGDSITYGDGSSRGGYPSILQEKLFAAGYAGMVLNEGISGERTYSTHARWLREIANADIALIMIGINDLINPGNCYIPYHCQTIEHIEAMINEALISKKIPILSTVTPAETDGIRAWVNPYIRSLNSRIKSLAMQYNIPLVDNYQAIRDNGGDALYADHVHFTDAGYAVIAQQWFDAIVAGKLIEAALK
ncbi:MAG: SGNH/GDSL hydrolase family protein [Candidatus Vecturithrix sp.]|nr:SGNH/GDSL hydrolase family protein [Candidatus Vecturithrix sp.]